jgi:CRISPR-associated endonuclease/helicase Cas3
MTFTEFFESVWGKNQKPFPWQERLARLALEGRWPAVIGLPTAAGKTAVIDIAVYALAMGAPNAARRIFFVVDRRVIVDEAGDRAVHLAERLCEADPDSVLGATARSLREIGRTREPLVTAILHSGTPGDEWWTNSPLQPAVICSTVDQIGSSLLFRGYGASKYEWPVRAGLVSCDSLIILDEALSSQPFTQTLGCICRYRSWADQPLKLPLTIVEMSATQSLGQAFREDEADRSNAILKRRWEAEKRVKLVSEAPKAGEKADSAGFTTVAEQLVREARAMRDHRGAKVIGVVANRILTARKCYRALKEDAGCEAILLTGRSRPYDRNRIWQRWRPVIGMDRRASASQKPVFVVATQNIEVGANIDFDALVTEIASLDALAQRFGRLDRNGNKALTYAAVIAQRDQIGSNYDDPVYGKSLNVVWKWLKYRQSGPVGAEPPMPQRGNKPKMRKGKEEFVNMGVFALRQAIEDTAETDRVALVIPRANAPVLMPAHLDLLCQTSPAPAVEPEPALFLHGPETGPPDVQVIWRQDLGNDVSRWGDVAAICPPNAAEAISVPIWAVRRWLSKQGSADIADLEGLRENEVQCREGNWQVLEWLGTDEAVLSTADQIRPGATIIVPSEYGGCDEWGWDPESESEVKDIGDQVKLLMGRPMLRLHSKLVEDWNDLELAKRLRSADSVQDVRAALLGPLHAEIAEWVKAAASAICRGRIKLVGNPHEATEDWAAVIGKATFSQGSVRSSYTTEVCLEDHLKGCEDWAWSFARELPERARASVARAASLHDIGKADPRFQAWLRGGNPIKSKELIAKSYRSGQNWAAIKRARELAGYPDGGRHELLSVALLAEHAEAFDELDFDLFLHLIGSHHGRCRPFAPVVQDVDPVRVAYRGWSAPSNHGLERVGSSVCEGFWRLTRRYGWYGLAYLETLMRLADYRQSEAEQTQVH